MDVERQTDLAIEEIAPGIGRHGMAERRKVAELGHGVAQRGRGIAANAEGGDEGSWTS